MTLFDEEIARLDVERADLAARGARETNDGRRAYVDAIVARVERARATLAAAAAADSGVEKPTTTGRDVARVHARDLTPRRFRLEYVATDTPVVIEGLGSALTEDGADGETCAWLTRRAGNKKVAVTRKDGHRRATLSCEVTDVLDLKDFFAEVVDDRGELLVRHVDSAQAAVVVGERARTGVRGTRLHAAHDAIDGIFTVVAELVCRREEHAIVPARRSVAGALFHGHGARHEAMDRLLARIARVFTAELVARHARSRDATVGGTRRDGNVTAPA